MPGGTGRTFDWSALPTGLAQPLVLSGGLTAANVGGRDPPRATMGRRRVERRRGAWTTTGKPRKGIKDPARIAAFIEEVRNADG